MSLVNDMLRDLDQRRKETSGSASSVALTPAPEVPRDPAKRSFTVYIVLALIIGAGAVAWFWTQQRSSNTTRQLEIAPTIVSEPVAPAPSESIVATIDPDTAQSQTDMRGLGEPRLEPQSIENDTLASSISSEEQVRELATARDTSIGSELEGQDSTPIVAGTDSVENDESQAEVIDNDDAELDATVARNEDTVDLSTQPTQEVKNSAELSPEERDLMAVQEALRQIADNETPAAYLTLEEQILSNRYAHQSRETYAKLLMNEGNLLGAYELNEGGLALSPNHAGFKKVKARILIADGQLDEAVQLLLSRAPAVDEDLEYHDILATAQLASRDYAGALISYTELVQQDQGQGKWWYGFAASQDSLGNANAARQGYSQAVAMPNLSASLRRRSQERLAILSQ